MEDLADRVFLEITESLDTPESKFGPKLNIWEFVTHPDWIGETPKPAQAVLLKFIYRLWSDIPFTDDELRIIEILQKDWGIDLDLSPAGLLRHYDTFVINFGRRSGKSRLISWINAYSAYELIYLDNPQRHYGLVQEQPIEIWHTAASDNQARDVFLFTRNNIIKCPFFRPYYDGRKQNESELRLFSPQDLRSNAQAILENKLRAKHLGLPKTPNQDGTILIKSIPTNAFTQRGKSIRTLVFSEFAHLQRAAEGATEEEFLENPRTDAAMWRALIPSTKDYKDDALVIVESTPLEKAGTFHKLYVMGGGLESDEDDADAARDATVQTFQLSTWEARPEISRDSLEAEFRRDPLAAEREYGAHFQNPVAAFLSPEVIGQIFVPGRVADLSGGRNGNIIVVDPAKNSDVYAVGWGYREGDLSDLDGVKYVIAGLMGFLPEGGNPVDPVVVGDWIVNVLYPALGGNQGNVYEICYDQWNSMEAVSRMQHMRMPALETTFTNKYKETIYTEFFNRTRNGQVECYTVEMGPQYNWANKLRLELSYLQVIRKGRLSFFRAPTAGPVRTDDFADVASNLVYRLVRMDNPTVQSMQQDARGILPPRGAPSRVIRPRKGAGFWRK